MLAGSGCKVKIPSKQLHLAQTIALHCSATQIYEIISLALQKQKSHTQWVNSDKFGKNYASLRGILAKIFSFINTTYCIWRVYKQNITILEILIIQIGSRQALASSHPTSFLLYQLRMNAISFQYQFLEIQIVSVSCGR